MKIFVTGATGFVGATLARRLHDRGDSLRFLLRDGSDTAGIADLDYETINGDLFDDEALRVGSEDCDAVIHMAALVSFRKRDRELMFRINADASQRLARIAKSIGVHRFVQVSSVAAVGSSPRSIALDEETPWPDNGMGIGYCDSKRLGEDLVRAENDREFEVVVVNPSSMFGPGDRRKAEGSLLDRMAQGRVPFCPPGGSCFADVRDVADGIVAALLRGRAGQRYILGGENLRGRELLQKIANVTGTKPPRFTMPNFLMGLVQSAQRMHEMIRDVKGPLTAELIRLSRGYSWFTSAKAESELGYTSRGIDEALQLTFEWMFSTGLLERREEPRAGSSDPAA